MEWIFRRGKKFSAQEFCIVIQGSRAGSCERQMVEGPSEGHLNGCNRYLEMATKCVTEKIQMLQKTDTNRQGEVGTATVFFHWVS